MKWFIPALMAAAIVTGCTTTKKANNTDSANGVPAMNVATVDVPAPSTAPPASFTPAQQPVITEPVATEAAEEPVEEVAMVEDVAPARPVRSTRARSSGSRYKVKKGESLWSIAQAKYGNGNKWKAIAAANPGMDPDHIQAGPTIVLP